MINHEVIKSAGHVRAIDPSTLSPLAWYDFDDTTTLFTDDGVTNVSASTDLVYRANDISGNGHIMRQTVEASRPTFYTSVQNGLDAVIVPLAGRMTSSTLFLTQPLTAFVVGGYDSTTNPRYFFDDISSPDSIIMYNHASGGHRMYAGTVLSYSGTDDTNVKLHSAVFNSTASKYSVNNSDFDTGNVGTGEATNGTCIGNRAISSYGCNNYLCEMVFFDKVLTDKQIAGVNRWLNEKWGLYAA